MSRDMDAIMNETAAIAPHVFGEAGKSPRD